MPGIQLIMQNSASPTDRYNELLALMEGDRDLLRELIDVFFEDAPERLDAVRRALADRDAGALYRAAHALKGSAGNFGAPNVVGRANRLEALARENELDASALEFELLETDVNQLVAELAAARTLP
jgi:HPt (histidine-containing phosphotransfer) domain-containing protein